jgi:hypothetical protein
MGLATFWAIFHKLIWSPCSWVSSWVGATQTEDWVKVDWLSGETLLNRCCDQRKKKKQFLNYQFLFFYCHCALLPTFLLETRRKKRKNMYNIKNTAQSEAIKLKQNCILNAWCKVELFELFWGQKMWKLVRQLLQTLKRNGWDATDGRGQCYIAVLRPMFVFELHSQPFRKGNIST